MVSVDAPQTPKQVAWYILQLFLPGLYTLAVICRVGNFYKLGIFLDLLSYPPPQSRNHQGPSTGLLWTRYLLVG